MLYEKFCADCGAYFVARGKSAKYCSECGAIRAKISQQNAEAAAKAKLTVNPCKTFRQILKEISEYNCTHGKALSYGQYVMLFGNKAPPKKVRVKKG